MDDLNIGNLLAKHTTGLRITNNFLTLFTHYGNFIDEEIKEYPLDVIMLEYECNEIAKKGFKIVKPELDVSEDTVFIPLTDEEMEIIDKWLVEYWSTSNFINIQLSCYDPNDNNLYKGVLSLQEIKEKGYVFTEENCDFAVGKYDTTKNEYVKVKAIIREDGSYIIDPGDYCSACVLFLDEEEWNSLPPPTKEQQMYYYIKYNFKTGEWYDSRTVQEMEEFFSRKVKEKLDNVNYENAIYYLDLPQFNSQLATRSLTYINTEEEDIEENTKLFNYGVESINNLFNTNITTKIDTTDKKWLLAQFKKTYEVVEGQKKAWLDIPEAIKKQDNPPFNLSIPSEWDKLIESFDNWVDSIYGE